MSKGAIGLMIGVGLLAALLASGCGSDSGASSLTKAQFTQQANAICKKQWQEGKNSAIQGIEKEIKGKPTKKDQEEAALKILEQYERTVAQLEALGPPTGQEQKVGKAIESMSQAAEKVQADPGTALVSDLPFRQANKMVAELGLTRCEA